MEEIFEWPLRTLRPGFLSRLTVLSFGVIVVVFRAVLWDFGSFVDLLINLNKSLGELILFLE